MGQTKREFLTTIGIGAALAVLPKPVLASSFCQPEQSLMFTWAEEHEEYLLRSLSCHELNELHPGDRAFRIQKSTNYLSGFCGDEWDQAVFSLRRGTIVRKDETEFRKTNPKWPIFITNVEANKIARLTRRGKANHYVIHPDSFLRSVYESPYLYGNIHYRNWVPKNSVFMFYKGKATCDCAGRELVGNRLAIAPGWTEYARVVHYEL